MKMNAEIKVFLALAAVIAVLAVLSVPPEFFLKPETKGIQAPELAPGRWINSEPLKLENLRGKVVLVDFWTYSCINCVRTMPYLRAWHEKYVAKGLVIIGVHTPEFEFEKDYENVKAAVERYGLRYPVVQDNDYATWNAFGNRYWPRKYLIDKEGLIRYDHIGEGAYEETERTIVSLLGGTEMNVSSIQQNVSFLEIGTPELYLGYKFSRQQLGNSEGFVPESVVDYKETAITQANAVYLSGKWLSKEDRIISVENSSLRLVYKAKDVNIVAGGSSSIGVFTDRTKAGTFNISGAKLYNIISAENYGIRLLEIRASPGLELYTFTFG